MKTVDGCVVAPKGFFAAGKATGLKRKRKDMSLIYSEKPCDVAAMFTTNKVKASSVIYNMDLYKKGAKARAVIVNSGNANACTGTQGLENTRRMAEETQRREAPRKPPWGNRRYYPDTQMVAHCKPEA